MNKSKFIISGICIFLISLNVWAAKDEIAWNTVLKNQFFGDQVIDESDDLLTLQAPYRAEDAALVPIRISSKINQTAKKYIKKITILIDKNPTPFAAEFDFTPLSGKADIAMRMRVNTYSYIRAIAQMNDGTLHMTKKFVKASGGCSAPIGADIDAAMQRLGKMKFRLDNGVNSNQPTQAQLLISHPNITGMQMDQVSRFIRPAHFVEYVNVYFNDQPVLTAKTDIAVSADPNFRFYFIPDGPGELRAEITDTQGQQFTKSYKID